MERHEKLYTWSAAFWLLALIVWSSSLVAPWMWTVFGITVMIALAFLLWAHAVERRASRAKHL